jgi:hypothetical protein
MLKSSSASPLVDERVRFQETPGKKPLAAGFGAFLG